MEVWDHDVPRDYAPGYYGIARGRDDRPVRADRERKSSGSETTFAQDLTDPTAIEAGVLAMADDVWSWCDKTGARGRSVTVKIKWADFQQCTRSRTCPGPIASRADLHAASPALVRSVFPAAKGVRLVGVTLSNFQAAVPDAVVGSLLEDPAHGLRSAAA